MSSHPFHDWRASAEVQLELGFGRTTTFRPAPRTELEVQLEALRLEVESGVEVPVVEWSGLKVHRLVLVDQGGEGITRCGRRILEDLVDLVGSARALSRPRPCLNCHRAERRSP